MTEPPLFGPAAGSGPSPQSDLPGPDAPSPPLEPFSNPQAPIVPPSPTADLGVSPGPGGWTPATPQPTPPAGPAPTVGLDWSTTPAYNPVPATPATTGGSRSAAVAVVVVAIAVAALGVILALAFIGTGGNKASPAASNGISASSASASSTSGASVVVFTDDFKDPGSGWATDVLPSGTTYAYSDHGLVVHAVGTLHHITSSPYGRARNRLTVSATATQSSPAPGAAGFGVTCDRGTDKEEVRYAFIAYSDKTWTVERKVGPLSATGEASDVLKEGTLAVIPGSTPMTVEGTCISQADALTTKLTMVVNGIQVTELTDTATALPGLGWYTELLVASDDPPTTVTVSHFEVRTVP